MVCVCVCVCLTLVFASFLTAHNINGYSMQSLVSLAHAPDRILTSDETWSVQHPIMPRSCCCDKHYLGAWSIPCLGDVYSTRLVVCIISSDVCTADVHTVFRQHSPSPSLCRASTAPH